MLFFYYAVYKMATHVGFKNKYDLPSRIAHSSKIKNKYTERIPVIIQLTDPLIQLDKYKYLVPNELTVGQFMYVIRRRIKLSPEHALFVFTDDNAIPCVSTQINVLYKTHADKDGFLYLTIRQESVFGAMF